MITQVLDLKAQTPSDYTLQDLTVRNLQNIQTEMSTSSFILKLWDEYPNSDTPGLRSLVQFEGVPGQPYLSRSLSDAVLLLTCHENGEPAYAAKSGLQISKVRPSSLEDSELSLLQDWS